jgi:transaldolase
VEAISTKSSDIIPEAEALAQLHPNIVVKIPMTTEGLKAIKILSKKDVKTNCTLVFSVNQALFAAKAGATYTSPFIGRLDDIGHHGMGLIKDILTVYKNYNFKTQVIVASVRHPMHMVEAALLGADIATAPYKVLEFMTKHPLTDIGIERFLKDWSKVKK